MRSSLASSPSLARIRASIVLTPALAALLALGCSSSDSQPAGGAGGDAGSLDESNPDAPDRDADAGADGAETDGDASAGDAARDASLPPDAGVACADLFACCAHLSGTERDACDDVVGRGLESACDTARVGYESSGACPRAPVADVSFTITLEDDTQFDASCTRADGATVEIDTDAPTLAMRVSCRHATGGATWTVTAFGVPLAVGNYQQSGFLYVRAEDDGGRVFTSEYGYGASVLAVTAWDEPTRRLAGDATLEGNAGHPLAGGVTTIAASATLEFSVDVPSP